MEEDSIEKNYFQSCFKTLMSEESKSCQCCCIIQRKLFIPHNREAQVVSSNRNPKFFSCRRIFNKISIFFVLCVGMQKVAKCAKEVLFLTYKENQAHTSFNLQFWFLPSSWLLTILQLQVKTEVKGRFSDSGIRDLFFWIVQKILILLDNQTLTSP